MTPEEAEQSSRLRAIYRAEFQKSPLTIPVIFGNASDRPQRWHQSPFKVRVWWPVKCWLIRRLEALAGWLRRLP